MSYARQQARRHRMSSEKSCLSSDLLPHSWHRINDYSVQSLPCKVCNLSASQEIPYFIKCPQKSNNLHNLTHQFSSHYLPTYTYITQDIFSKFNVYRYHVSIKVTYFTPYNFLYWALSLLYTLQMLPSVTVTSITHSYGRSNTQNALASSSCKIHSSNKLTTLLK